MGGVCLGGKPESNATFSSTYLDFYTKIKNIEEEKDDSYSNYSSKDLQKTTKKYDHSNGKQSPLRFTKMATSTVIISKTSVEVLGTIRNSVSNSNDNCRLVSDKASRRSRISILAFEVANTIVRGAKLLHSLSEENIKFLKEEILQSEGVQLLISTDTDDLLNLAAADKMQEFDVFLCEVVRFGDLCKDPKWHNLGRNFSRLQSDDSSRSRARVEAETTLQELTTLAQNTSELYQELNALDKFEHDYRRKIEEMESLNPGGKVESVDIFLCELNVQQKHVRSLKKKSLWSRNMDEIVGKLVRVVICIHQRLRDAFGDKVNTPTSKESTSGPQRLGIAGLALHYANIIHQINSIACRPTPLPSNLRDALYRGLPTTVKTAFRSRLHAMSSKEELTASHVRTEMDKTLKWIVPIATNTSRAHQAFGWIGEWANSSNDSGQSKAAQNRLIWLQTLYHADKHKTETYILELVTWLHYLIRLVRTQNQRVKRIRDRSPTPKELTSQFMRNRTQSFDVRKPTENGQVWVSRISSNRQEYHLAKQKETAVWTFSNKIICSPAR